MYEYGCENCTSYCTCNYCTSFIAVTVMMTVVTMTAVSYDYWTLNYYWFFNDYRTLYYNRALYNHWTLNDYWSFNDYRSVMVVMMSWKMTNLNNRSVMMMAVVMVTSFNAMMITVMMLCRN